MAKWSDEKQIVWQIADRVIHGLCSIGGISKEAKEKIDRIMSEEANNQDDR